MKKSAIFLLASLLVTGWTVHTDATVIRIDSQRIINNGTQPIEAVIVDSDGNGYRQMTSYDPSIRGIYLDMRDIGPGASVYFPDFGSGYIWYNGYWVDQTGYYWNGRKRVVVKEPDWSTYWARHWHGRINTGWSGRGNDSWHGNNQWRGQDKSGWQGYKEERKEWDRHDEKDNWRNRDDSNWRENDKWRAFERNDWHDDGQRPEKNDREDRRDRSDWDRKNIDRKDRDDFKDRAEDKRSDNRLDDNSKRSDRRDSDRGDRNDRRI